MRRIARRADGLELSLEEHGDPSPGAPAFLLVPGFAQTTRSFTAGPLPKALLAQGAQVFIGALRGHDSERRQGPARDLREHFELDLPALLSAARAHSSGPLVYLGHSMGGVLGYALLGRPNGLHALWAFAAPLQLAPRRLDLRVVARASMAISRLLPAGTELPTGALLSALAEPLSRPDASIPLLALQRYVALTNPALAEPEALRATLRDSVPESPGVLRDMARLTSGRTHRVAGVDICAAAQAAKLPIGVVVGGRDIFAPRASVRGLEVPGQAGPRLVVELPQASHVDVCLGHHLDTTVQTLWDASFPVDSPSGLT